MLFVDVGNRKDGGRAKDESTHTQACVFLASLEVSDSRDCDTEMRSRDENIASLVVVVY